jgi:peptide/nickel transport system permease protein
MSTPELTLGAPPRIGRRTRIRRRFLRRPMAVTGLVLAALFTLMAIFAPLIAPYDAGATDFGAPLAGPSGNHLLGTDELGRDTFSRIVYGARASMQVGLLATALAMLVGVPLGLIAGYFRGWRDPVISRITDVMLAFPFIVVAVGLAAIFGPSLTNATIALVFLTMPGILRVTRGETLALREEDYVRAAVANGAGDAVILRRHILPNLMSTLLVQATVTIPQAILGEALLSFLGLGVQPPTPSWGVMLSAAQPLLGQAPLLAVFPGVAVALATLSFNLLGDGLRDVLDPRMTR